MAYKKKNRGAGLTVRKEDNILTFMCSYFDKWVMHEVDLDKQQTEVMIGFHYYPVQSKPLKWMQNILGNQFIDYTQEFDGATWDIDLTNHGKKVIMKKTIPSILIGDDFRNINLAKFVAKVASNLSSYLKQEGLDAVVDHHSNLYHNTIVADSPRKMLRPDILPTCIEVVINEFPHLDPNIDHNAIHDYRNVVEITQGREPELEDLPF
jgi:hypothetical protein